MENITKNMPWDFQDDIGHLQTAIQYLKEAIIKSEWIDDGSGKEYTERQYQKAHANRKAAIDEIEQAMVHILDVV